MGSYFGRFLIKRFNFFVRVVMKKAFGARLGKHVHNHYLNALKEPGERKGCWTFPKRIIGSSEWLSRLWNERERISDKPSLILWGKKDIAFRDKESNTWKGLFQKAETHEFETVGHFVQEELGTKLCPVIEDFVTKHLE